MISCTVPFLEPLACEDLFVHARMCKQTMLCYVVHACSLRVVITPVLQDLNLVSGVISLSGDCFQGYWP